MRQRRARHKKIIRDKNTFVFIVSFILVLLLSVFISSNLANFIYKGSVNAKSEYMKSEDADDKSYENEVSQSYDISEDSIILFQGGVFKDLENAEEFKDKINNDTLVSIINDGKYERAILGVSTKNTFSDMSNFLKSNNIQFVKQVYKIPLNKNDDSKLLEIIDIFTNFIMDSFESLSEDEIDTTKLKKELSSIDYTNDMDKEILDLILDIDDNAKKSELESVLDYLYVNFTKYKV